MALEFLLKNSDDTTSICMLRNYWNSDRNCLGTLTERATIVIDTNAYQNTGAQSYLDLKKKNAAAAAAAAARRIVMVVLA